MSFQLINQSTSLGTAIYLATQNMTGDLTLTLIAIIVFIAAMLLMFRFGGELLVAVLLPVVIVIMAYTSGPFRLIGGLMALVLAVVFVRHFIAN